MPPKTRMKLAEKNSNKKTKAKKVSPPELMKPEYDGLRLQLTELAEGAQARGAEQDALNAETIAGLAKNGIGVDTQVCGVRFQDYPSGAENSNSCK